MKNQKIQILGYRIYFLTNICFVILFLVIQNQQNWIAFRLKELSSYFLTGFTIIFLVIAIYLYIKSKNKKILSLSLIAIIPYLISIPFISTYLDNSLNERIEKIELTYIAWACDCANWATKDDLKKYAENIGDSLANRSIFIEPANKSIKIPDTLGYSGDIIRFVGQFYNKKGFPKGYVSFEDPNESRIFRYTDYEVLKSNYREYKESIQEEE